MKPLRRTSPCTETESVMCAVMGRSSSRRWVKAGASCCRASQAAPPLIVVPSPQNNHHVHNISAKMAALREKVSELERAAAQRKAKLDENSAFLQFNWKADVVESWIGTGTFTLPVQHHTFVAVTCASAQATAACTMIANSSICLLRKILLLVPRLWDSPRLFI